MKKLLSFIPLGVGISAAIIYVFNLISFKLVNDSSTNAQILSNLKVYLYIAIAGFIIYFMIKVLDVVLNNKKTNITNQTVNEDKESYEPFEKPVKLDQETKKVEPNDNSYVLNYDYVPLYHEQKKGDYLINEDKKQAVVEPALNNAINEASKTVNQKEDNEAFKNGYTIRENDLKNNLKYCYNCGEKISYDDKYCSSCGALLKTGRKNTNPVIKNVINVLEIVILILIIYFSLNMLFEYKESTDPNFTSPFKVSMTK